MRIAHLPSGFFPSIGGAQVVVHNIAEQQHLAGHEVFLISRATDSWSAFKTVKEQVSYTLLPLIPKTIQTIKNLKKYKINSTALLAMQLQYYQRKFNFDVWHLSTMGRTVMFSIPILKKMDVPLIGTCHGIDIQKHPGVGYGWRLDETWERSLVSSLNELDLITSISGSVREEYLSLGISGQKIHDIPNGVNFDFIRSLDVDKADVKRTMGLPEDKKLIICVGRNHPKKGFKHIPEVIKHLVELRQDFVWLLVGKGSEQIKAQADAAGVGDFMIAKKELGLQKKSNKAFQFPTDDLVALYKSADMFVFPTLMESFGLVNIEAMAAGIPVVTTEAKGSIDVVDHGINGMLSPLGDWKKMAENIHAVFSDEDLKSSLVENGLEHAASFNWPSVSNKYIESYESLIARNN